MVQKVASMIAVLAPWFAFVVLLGGAAVVVGQSRMYRKQLLVSLGMCLGSGVLLFVGPSVLRQHGLTYRCLPYLILIGVFLAAVVSAVVMIVVFFCRRERARLWIIWSISLSGLIQLAVCLLMAFMLVAFTVRQEETGMWNGQKAVMVEQGGGPRYQYYEYRGPIVVGGYLGASEQPWEGM